jgi:hypothetical protein
MFSGSCPHWLVTVSHLTLLQMSSSSRLPGYKSLTRVRVKITLGLAVFCQSFHLGDKHLETHNQNFYFPTEHLWLLSLCNILSDKRMGLSFTIAAWSSLTNSFSGQSPARLMTTLSCLRLKTPQTWRARSLYLYPPGTG